MVDRSAAESRTPQPARDRSAPHAPPAPTPAAASVSLQQYVPAELKKKLEAARTGGGIAGERKHVTVLFADIVGSTALAEKLDPEDWGEVVSGAHRRVSEAVYEYEGIIAQLLGDGVLAFFGAPITHEDDPVRAVNAALGLQKRIRQYAEEVRDRHNLPDFQMRAGVNSGLVVVGNVGNDLHMEYLAIGDTVNLAARLQSAAEGGTVLVSASTARAVRHAFELESVGDLELKGKSEPVPAFRVAGRKTLATRARGIEGLYAEMVGREAELEILTGVLTDLKQGVGRIVLVLGEAGVGKTRLVSECRGMFQKLIGSAGNWFETNTLSYESNQAYGLFQRLIRRVSGATYDDPPEVVREKLESLIADLPDEPRLRARQVLEPLLGVQSDDGSLPLEGEAFRQELLEATRAWWRGQFSNRPTVLAFDDIHWADAASVALFRQLLALTDELPLVLLCALRTERQAPAWQIKTSADDEFHHGYAEVTLRPLSEAESNELLNRLLAIPEIPDRLRASILEKSGGNPFFIEEVVRALIESGAVVPEERTVNGETRRYWRATSERADFEIPDNLQSLLAARMDRLEEATRGTLQMAAVIGRTFYRRVLQAVDDAAPELDKRVGTLMQLEMIREAARLPEVEYAFRNPLTQEAVYKTILVKRRREFHRRVGEAIESLYAGSLERLSGLLVHHFALAGERAKAVSYARQASQQAQALYAYDDAAQSLRAALELLSPGEKSETHLILREELGDIYRLLRDGEQAIAQYQQALDVWNTMDHPEKMTSVRLHRKIVQVVTELKWAVSLEELQRTNATRLASRAALEASLRQMEREAPHAEIVRAYVVLSMDAWRIQDPPDWATAQAFAQAAVDMAAQLDDPLDQSQALGALANVLDGRSRIREHLRVADERLALCRAPDSDLRERLEALRGAGAARMYVGEYEAALPYLVEAEALAAQAQVIDQQSNALGLQAQCRFRLDDWDQVLDLEPRWRDLERRYTRERVGETCFYVALSASIYALRGDQTRAEAYSRESFDYMQGMSGPPEGWQRNQFY